MGVDSISVKSTDAGSIPMIRAKLETPAPISDATPPPSEGSYTHQVLIGDVKRASARVRAMAEDAVREDDAGLTEPFPV
jgi:hypothetical protein